MRRVFLLLGACLIMVVVASPAMAQSTVYEELDERCAVFGSGFGTQLDAQEFYENNPADFELVDPNGDGQVCTAEDFTFAQAQGEQEGATTAQSTPNDTATAAQYADDEMTHLPDTGGIPLSGVAILGGVALIGGGLLLRYRLK